VSTALKIQPTTLTAEATDAVFRGAPPARHSGIRMELAAVFRWTAVVLVLAAASTRNACAQDNTDPGAPHRHQEKELVLFVSGEAHHISSSRSTDALNEDAWFSADIVLALTRDRFRLFGEYLLSAEEHDLERFQAGYELVPNTVAWLGRFHQPASAWNTEHHHGRYLQTSITRPSIELWEDESGIVPQHISGLLLDSRRPLGEAGGLQAALGSGLGPRIGERRLDAFDLLDPHEGRRRVSWTGRVAWLPDYAGASTFGIVFARHRIPVLDGSIVKLPAVTEIRQDVYGLLGDWTQDPWHVLAAVYDVRFDLRGAGEARSERFLAGYAQVARQLPRGVTAYGRVEDSSRGARSLYLSGNYADFEQRRVLAGLRWDVRSRHAITLEVGRGTTFRAHQNEFRLQWSAALP
jgi:hypothetical protein